MMEYVYLGDRNTSAFLRKQFCKAVRKNNGKCVRGKNGSMLVRLKMENQPWLREDCSERFN